MHVHHVVPGVPPVAPLVVAGNTEVGPVLSLGTAAVASPLWIVSGVDTLANARKCGRPDAYIAGISYLTVGASIPIAAGMFGGGLATGDLGLGILGGIGALSLGVVGLPMLVVGTVSSTRLLVVPSAGRAPGLTVVGRF